MPGPGEVPTQRSVTRGFDVFFDLHLNKRLGKQPWSWWFETPSWSLWRHCNGQQRSTESNTICWSLSSYYHKRDQCRTRTPINQNYEPYTRQSVYEYSWIWWWRHPFRPRNSISEFPTISAWNPLFRYDSVVGISVYDLVPKPKTNYNVIS